MILIIMRIVVRMRAEVVQVHVSVIDHVISDLCFANLPEIEDNSYKYIF